MGATTKHAEPSAGIGIHWRRPTWATIRPAAGAYRADVHGTGEDASLLKA